MLKMYFDFRIANVKKVINLSPSSFQLIDARIVNKSVFDKSQIADSKKLLDPNVQEISKMFPEAQKKIKSHLKQGLDGNVRQNVVEEINAALDDYQKNVDQAIMLFSEITGVSDDIEREQAAWSKMLVTIKGLLDKVLTDSNPAEALYTAAKMFFDKSTEMSEFLNKEIKQIENLLGYKNNERGLLASFTVDLESHELVPTIRDIKVAGWDAHTSNSEYEGLVLNRALEASIADKIDKVVQIEKQVSKISKDENEFNLGEYCDIFHENSKIWAESILSLDTWTRHILRARIGAEKYANVFKNLEKSGNNILKINQKMADILKEENVTPETFNKVFTGFRNFSPIKKFIEDDFSLDDWIKRGDDSLRMISDSSTHVNVIPLVSLPEVYKVLTSKEIPSQDVARLYTESSDAVMSNLMEDMGIQKQRQDMAIYGTKDNVYGVIKRRKHLDKTGKNVFEFVTFSCDKREARDLAGKKVKSALEEKFRNKKSFNSKNSSFSVGQKYKINGREFLVTIPFFVKQGFCQIDTI
jgi:hypothetical protein